MPLSQFSSVNCTTAQKGYHALLVFVQLGYLNFFLHQNYRLVNGNRFGMCYLSLSGLENKGSDPSQGRQGAPAQIVTPCGTDTRDGSRQKKIENPCELPRLGAQVITTHLLPKSHRAAGKTVRSGFLCITSS